MKKDDIIKTILLISKENIDYLSKDVSYNLCIKKEDSKKFEELIDSYFEFLKQEKIFFEMKKLENGVLSKKLQEFLTLAKKINLLKDNIIKLAKYFDDEKQKQINEIIKRVLKENNILFDKEMKKESYNIKNANSAIYDFVSSYIQILLFDEKNLKDINESLGFNLIDSSLDYIHLEKFFEENIWEEKKEINFFELENRTEKEIFYLRLEKLNMIYKLFKKSGMNALYKLDDLNAELLEIYDQTYEDIAPKFDSEGFEIKDELRHNKVKNAKQTDIFDVLFNYDVMALNDELSFSETKNDLALFEITDENGIFKNLSKKEIAYLLYGYFIIIEKGNELISSSEEYFFKDLSEITDLVARRKLDNFSNDDIEKTIDDVLKGKIKVNLKERKKTNS